MEYAIFSLQSLSTTEVSTPLPVTSSVAGMGAFTGLTGYMTLGLGAKQKPGAVQVNDSEVLITKDSKYLHSYDLIEYVLSKSAIDQGLVVGVDGKTSRTMDFPAPPEEIGKTVF